MYERIIHTVPVRVRTVWLHWYVWIEISTFGIDDCNTKIKNQSDRTYNYKEEVEKTYFPYLNNKKLRNIDHMALTVLCF